MATDLRQQSLRTCVGCRQRSPRLELLRVVEVEGAVVPDPHRRRGGRGAHVHFDRDCVALAERRRVWTRALRAAGSLDAAPVATWLSPMLSGTTQDVRPRIPAAARPEAGRPDPMSSR